MDSPLTEYRVKQNLSLEALGARFNVNKSTLWRWETGEVPIPVNRLDEIERETGIRRARLRPDIFGVRA